MIERLTVEMAAIQDHDGKVYSVPRPGRHHDVIKIMVHEGIKIPITGEQGFVLSNGNFVSRKAAKLIAINAHQLLERASKRDELFSECVW